MKVVLPFVLAMRISRRPGSICSLCDPFPVALHLLGPYGKFGSCEKFLSASGFRGELVESIQIDRGRAQRSQRLFCSDVANLPTSGPPLLLPSVSLCLCESPAA